MTNIENQGSGTGPSDGLPMIGRTVVAIVGGIALLFLAGIAAGYGSVMAEERSATPTDVAVLGSIALAFAGIAYAIWRFALRTSPAELAAGGPGEIRTRQRQRRQMLYIGLAGVIGGVVGGLTGFFDLGDGSLFGGDWENLKLPPMVALGLAVLLIGGFLVLPLWGFRMIDDYQREQNFIAFTGGCVSVLAGYPVWAVLHAGGFTQPPHAFGIFGIAYVSMIASFLYARWRL
jgi:hypothetical protein